MKKNACLLWKALFLGLILMITSGSNIFAQGGFNSLYAVQDPSSGNYVLIDSTGRIVTNTGHSLMRNLGEGITAFYTDVNGEESIIDLYDANGGKFASYNNAYLGPDDDHFADYIDDSKGFLEGRCAIRHSFDSAGYIDNSGKIIIKPQFYQAYNFHEGLASVRVKEKGWGYIDRSGNMVIPPQYDEAKDFHSGRAMVYLKSNNPEHKYQFIDRKGNIVKAFDNIAYFTEFNDYGLCVAGIEKKYRKSYGYSDGDDIVYHGNLGLMDTLGHWVVKPQYREMKEQSDGNWLVTTATNIPCCIDCSDDEQGDGIPKCKGLKWELIDPLGHTLIVIPPRFDDEGNPTRGNFYEIQTGYYTDRVTDGKWAILDCYGNELFGRHFNEIKHSYSIPGYFHVIENDGREVIIDRQGRKVIDVPQAPVVQQDQGEERSYVSCLWEKNGLFCFLTEVYFFENEWDEMDGETSVTIINRQGKVIWKTPLE